LSHVDSRRGKSTGMILAFLVYLTYTNMLAYAIVLIKNENVNSSAPIWLVHSFYLILACYCLYRRNYNLPLTPEFNLLSRPAKGAKR